MQEARDELTRRIDSLERRSDYLTTQKADLQAEIAEMDRELDKNSKLSEQYRQIVETLPVAAG